MRQENCKRSGLDGVGGARIVVFQLFLYLCLSSLHDISTYPTDYVSNDNPQDQYALHPRNILLPDFALCFNLANLSGITLNTSETVVVGSHSFTTKHHIGKTDRERNERCEPCHVRRPLIHIH